MSMRSVAFVCLACGLLLGGTGARHSQPQASKPAFEASKPAAGHVKPAASRASRRHPGEGRVLRVFLEGAITPVAAEALGEAIDRAESQGYSALVIQIDTPGGLESSMRAMVKRLLASEVPVIAWVAPS